jgi:hypothetical protein
MAQPDQSQLAQIVSAVIQALQVQGQSAAPNGATPKAKYGNSLEHKDRRLLHSFAKRGFKDVVLMDRADKSKPYNIRPYKGWIELGRRVRKGERGVMGLFHIDQTDVIAPAKPALTAEQKDLFDQAKKALKAKKAKGQPQHAA